MQPSQKLGLLLALFLAVFTFAAEGASLDELKEELPECALKCMDTLKGQTDCDYSDVACVCKDDDFLNSAKACLTDTCPILDELAARKMYEQGCDKTPRDRRREFYILFIVEFPAAIAPWLRLYGRWKTMGFFDIDDWLMLVAGVTYTVFLAIGHYIGQVGFGVDSWSLPVDTVSYALKLFYVDETLYFLCLCLSKVSVLFFYLRIFPHKFFKWATWATMAFIVVPTVVAVIMQIFQCTPVSFTWNGWMSDHRMDHCIDIRTLAYIAAAICILQDLVVLMLPLPLLLKLNVGTRSKIGIVFMFSLGVFILITSCVRVKYIDTFGHPRNPSWDYTDPLIWSGLEVSVSIIVACLPAIRVLIMTTFPGIFSSIRSNRPSGGYVEGMSDHGSKQRQKRSERFSGFFSSGNRGEENESQVELGLHLGDKTAGEVQTEIVGPGGSSHSSDDRGIRIKRTMTTRVDGLR